MFLTRWSYSLLLALAAALPVAACSLERGGNADDTSIDDDAPTPTDPTQVATGRVERDASDPVAPPASDAGKVAPAPSLQTVDASADLSSKPSADRPATSVVEPAVPGAVSAPVQPPVEPPAQPVEPHPQPGEPQPEPAPPMSEPPAPMPPPAPEPPPPPPPVTQYFTLQSADFAPDGALPQQFTCDGPSPQFSWQNAPSGVRSYALTLEQLDYRTSTSRLLWAMTNIPAGQTSLPRGYVTERGRFEAPICGGSQRYTYTLYALAQGPAFGNGVQSVTRVIRGGDAVFQPSAVLASATLVGYFNP